MEYLTQNKYWKLNRNYSVNKLLYLLIDRPDIISIGNDYIWIDNKSQQHRDYDLPSIWINSEKEIRFYYNNNRYRII